MGSIQRKMRRERERDWGSNKGRAQCKHCLRFMPLTKMVTYDVNGRHIWTGCNECSFKHGQEIDVLGRNEQLRQAEGTVAPVESRAVEVRKIVQESERKRKIALIVFTILMFALGLGIAALAARVMK